MAGYCSISARRNVIKMTLESVDDTIFSLSDILYTTLRASDEVLRFELWQEMLILLG